MRETAASGLEAAGLYRTVGIPVVEGLAGFHRVAYDPAVVLLLPVRFDLWQIGGSHAQRDLLNWTPRSPCAPVSATSPCRWDTREPARAAPQPALSPPHAKAIAD